MLRNVVGHQTSGPSSTSPVRDGAAATRAAAVDDRFFRHVVSSMRSAVVVVHTDGAIALMNDEAYRICSLTRQPGNVGRPFSDVFADRPELLAVLKDAFELTTTLPNRAELRLKDPDRVIGHTLSQVKDEQDAVVGAVLLLKDLTHVERQEERERLRDRLASLGEMAAGIAHELKNPLAGITVLAGLLRRKVSDSPDMQSILTDIISEASLANSIVGEMLEFVRPVRLECERTNVADVLTQALKLAESKGEHGRSTLHLEVAEDLPIIDGDPHQLCQVFTNLLTNALEALNGQGRVDVTAVSTLVERESGSVVDPPRHAPAVVIDVVDDGPGVRPELIDRIFDPFFTTKAEGSGLGLSIVRKIVDAHNGRIDMTVMPGRGTRFRVTLPVAA